MKKIKEKKAITLIALTITVVVLIIIGGILVSLTIGNNGVFKTSKVAKEQHEYASAYEIVKLKILEATTEYLLDDNIKQSKIEYLKNYMAKDSEVNIEIVRYESIAYIKQGLENYSGNLIGFYVVVPKYNKYTFLIGEYGEIEQVSSDGVNFEYLREFNKKSGINDNIDQSSEVFKKEIIASMKKDILEKIALITQEEASLDMIPETLTQAEIEKILEKYGTIKYDENYNIIEVQVSNTGMIIPIASIYATTTYKEEESTVKIGDSFSFTKKMNVSNQKEKLQEYEIPRTGVYKIECWGAQGGANGGYGAYTCGTIRFRKQDIVYICVGEQGKSNTSTEGGFNGGGYSSTSGFSAGGGATDIRLVKADTIYDNKSLASRIMVAAGGSGGNRLKGMPGGGLTGKVGQTYNLQGTLATQISPATDAMFGRAANVDGYAGAGGGYYGGGPLTASKGDQWIGTEGQNVSINGTQLIKYGAGNSWVYGVFTNSVYLSNSVFGDPCYGTVKSGYIVNTKLYLSSGGSSYISGHEGCIAIKSENDITPKVEEYSQLSDSIHYSGNYFKDTYMCAGDETAENGERGNSGDGRVKITVIQ